MDMEKHITVRGVGVRTVDAFAQVEREWGEGTVQATIDANAQSLKDAGVDITGADVAQDAEVEAEQDAEAEAEHDAEEGLIMRRAAFLARLMKLPPQCRREDMVMDLLTGEGDHEASILFCLATDFPEEYDALVRFACVGKKD